MKPKRLWILNTFIFPLIPPSRCHAMKLRALRWAGGTIGTGSEVMSSARIIGDFTLHVGEGCFIGHEAMLLGPYGSSITLDDHTKIGSRVILVTGSHRFSIDGDCIEKEGTSADIRICQGAAVSTGSIVLPGITVGRMAHVAAGSVVTRNVPEFCRVAGVPARVIRDFRARDQAGPTQ